MYRPDLQFTEAISAKELWKYPRYSVLALNLPPEEEEDAFPSPPLPL